MATYRIGRDQKTGKFVVVERLPRNGAAEISKRGQANLSAVYTSSESSARVARAFEKASSMQGRSPRKSA